MCWLWNTGNGLKSYTRCGAKQNLPAVSGWVCVGVHMYVCSSHSCDLRTRTYSFDFRLLSLHFKTQLEPQGSQYFRWWPWRLSNFHFVPSSTQLLCAGCICNTLCLGTRQNAIPLYPPHVPLPCTHWLFKNRSPDPSDLCHTGLGAPVWSHIRQPWTLLLTNIST